MAGTAGLEPVTSCVTGRRSNQAELHPQNIWCKNGVSIFEISKLLGHKDIKTTMRYAHLADRELVEVTNKGGKMFEANNKYFA